MTDSVSETEAIRFRIAPCLRVLVGTAIFLVLASLAGQIAFYSFGYDKNLLLRLFNIDAEHNVPTFFSAILLLASALLLGVNAAAERKQKSRGVLGWTVLAAGFVLMSLDEIAVLHEKLIDPVRGLLGSTGGIFYFAWVIPALIVIFVVGICFFRFLARLAPKTRFAFLASGAVYLAGAVGFEFIAGHYAFENGTRTLAYQLLATAEEILEMAGAILFIRALLVRLADHFSGLAFRFEK